VAHAQGPQPSAAAAANADLAKRIEKLNSEVNEHLDAGRIAEAIPPAREKLDLVERGLGKDHWRTGGARRELETCTRLAGQPSSVQDRYVKARQAEAQAIQLYGRGQFAEAVLLLREATTIWRDILGADHPDTASGYSELAENLRAQGEHVEAEAMHRRALAIFLKALGESHPYSATGYNNLAVTLRDEEKLAESELMHRRALAIKLKALVEGDPSTAISYANLARTLSDEGKSAAAEAMHRRALAIFLKVLGEVHPHTANSYNNLAVTLRDQGKHAEAEAMHRRALAIRIKVQGESHPGAALGYSYLAQSLRDQGKFAEAEAMDRRALAIQLKAHGEDHPNTANSYSNLAATLDRLGKSAEAEALHRHAVAIDLKARGEDHPHTAISYSNLARSLDLQGKPDNALRTWAAAATSYELARLRGAKGFEAALTAGTSPLPAFATALARAGQPRDAWTRWEQGLARAVLDEVARPARPLTRNETAREADLLGRSQALDERIGRLVAQARLMADDEKRLDGLRREQSDVRRQLLDFQLELEQKYGPLAGKSATLDEARTALDDDTALVGWVDTDLHHAACVVRRSGNPAWVTIPGSGEDGAWTKDDETSARRLRDALAARALDGELRPLAEEVARKRLGPVEPHLKGVRRVVVVNSPGLTGLPVEALFTARGKAGEPAPVVAYTPSASMLTFLAKARSPAGRPATILALGDPAYPAPKAEEGKVPAPPDHGLFVARVESNGIADLFGIKAGDVLLDYNGTTLKTRDDLHPISANVGPTKIPLQLWRAGETRTIEVAAGPVGVEFDKRPAAPVVLAQRAATEVLHVRGESQTRLPGTRREVAAIEGLFPSDKVTTLLGEQARESVVQDLARSGKLKDFRFLHFAAHGRNDPRSAYRTALILAPDPDRSADPAAFDTDGEITAEQIGRTWELDADLVVLSACESALGKQAGGEGFLGFAQPLLAKGARSLVLSLWRVDDKATSLLMARFYQNLLGKRSDLSKPMPKAEALAEAKNWLRNLTEAEVGPALAVLDRGSLRPLVTAEESKPAKPSARRRPSGPRPFEHPYYWAAFILVGDPS
jgi:tetratricopeptide (TPR) repeat protein